ncbi:MAG: hypothetical protein O2782_23645 [bacterium]|nr:hypothetical protein [bacterium]
MQQRAAVPSTSRAVSHRSILLLLLVATATRGLSYSRANVNEVGLACFSLILVGLLVALFVRGPWQGSSDTVGGISPWKVALPCAYFYVFAANAGRYLFADLEADWQVPLQWLSAAAAVLALPVLLLTMQRFRDLLGRRGQIIILVMPLLPVLTFYLLTPIASPTPGIDVYYFQLQAAQALLTGWNPYEFTFVNIYGSGTELYPTGEAVSYPYPPMSFAFALVGHLLGDVRWSLIACHLAAAGLLFATARQRALPITDAIVFGGLFLYLPYGPFVSEQAWTDPTVTFSLGLMSLFLARRQPTAALWAAGLAIACKQTMILLVPLLWALWRRIRGAHLLPLFAIAAVTYGAFLLWNAGALWDDVVTFHLLTPFRARALTYSAYVNYLTDSPPPAWLGLVALVTGVTTAVVGLRSGGAAATPCDGARVWRFYAGLCFAYLVTALCSKHAFMNYYYVVYFTLVAALVWSRITDGEDSTC